MIPIFRTGSLWECIADCYAKGKGFNVQTISKKETVVIESVNHNFNSTIIKVKKGEAELYMHEDQFKLCFKEIAKIRSESSSGYFKSKGYGVKRLPLIEKTNINVMFLFYSMIPILNIFLWYTTLLITFSNKDVVLEHLISTGKTERLYE